MPYMIADSGKRTCVHVKNPDGSAGSVKHCYTGPDRHAKAKAYMRALYANVPEASSKGLRDMSKLKRDKEKERRRLRRLQKAAEEKALLESVDNEVIEEDEAEEELLEEEFDGEEPVEEEVKSLQKDYDMAMPPMMATSFDELDAERESLERAEQAHQVACDVRSLVLNIVYSSTLDASAKAKAIQKVGADFEGRVKEAIGEVKKDFDLLELEAVIARDNRSMDAGERVGNFLKEALSYGSKKAMPDSAYALVIGEGDQKIRKYLIHDKAHVRNALARAAQQIKRGAEPGAGHARKALPAIRAAAKKFGIEASVEKDRNALVITKDAAGDFRWVGWVSNNFIDYDGDIISKEAHEEFVGWLDQNSEYAPVFMSWHTPATVRKNRVDFWSFENGFLLLSGKLTADEAEGLLKASAITDLGMSHQAFVLSRDKQDLRVVTKYRMYEASDLALENAANPFTTLDVCAKEVGMKKEAYLAQILGSEELAKQYLEAAGVKQAELREAGIEEKAKKDEAPAPPETPVAPAAPVVEQPAPDVIAVAIKKALAEEVDLPGLNDWVTKANESIEKVDVLEQLIKDLMESQDDRLAKALTPPAERMALAWSQNRASQADATLLGKSKGDKALADAAPELPEGYAKETDGDYWLKGIKPVKAPATEEVS